jgi:SAM-dependent methyltransferase
MTRSAGYDDSLFPVLERLEPGNFWFRSRNRLIVWAVRTYVPGARSFLEVGCGTGFVMTALDAEIPELALTGVELSHTGLEIAQRRLPNATLLELDARALPYDSEFDVVAALDVLEHIPEDRAVLENMARAVRPGGTVLVSVPQHPRLWSAADDVAMHERRYTRKGLVEKVTAAGLVPVRVTSFTSLLLPLMALSRLRNRKAVDYDFESEFRLSPRIQRVFEQVMNLERRAIERGVCFPAGGSLFVVARRPAPTMSGGR